ncbi:MAG: 5'-nucleotidase C-terminal domain-containing protein [Desulfuromonadales bacterium]|nr:5'-nucleotidase C-terminal domain-containing protein [Desulfuromonadales bacterium]
MGTSLMKRSFTIIGTLAVLILAVSSTALPAPTIPVSLTILHTNDFHGQLEASGSNPGAARVATVVNSVRAAVGATNVLLVDTGDEMQGSLLSNTGDGTATGKGIPTIATFNAMGYNVATFGNHEFDWGQINLGNRTTQATYPFVTANIVQNNSGNCATAGWTKPVFADAPYQLFTMGTAPNTVKVAFIGVTTMETPTITVASATAGLCFKDPADSILHYYDSMKADGADVIVVLSHLGFEDGGYGYGIPVYGDKTLAAKLNTAGKPVNLIVGGHSHTNMTPPATVVSGTTVTQAYYNGRTVGRADVTVGTDGSVGMAWSRTTSFTAGAEDSTIKNLVTSYATAPAFTALVNQPVGYSAVDLARSPTSDNMMGTFIDDAIYNYLNSDGEPANDVDMFFNNAGGIRTDWCYNGSAWVNTGCVSGTHAAGLLTYGNMFTVLPFGNSTVVGNMTGAQVLEVLNYGPLVSNGVIQPAGIKYKYFSYKDANPGPQPYAWGAFDVTVYNKTTHTWQALDLKKTYKVGTNEFMAPAGGDGYSAFKYMTNITYWSDMLNQVNAYVAAHYGTLGTAYKGPDNDGTLDERIVRDGNDSTGSIVPLTILHHNDSHGNLAKGTSVGYTQLATLIKQEKVHNPNRTLLLNAGDTIQGDAMMYYFRSAPTGYASDGTPLGAALSFNPLIKAFNSMGYDAMTLGNHEFNFGRNVFKSVLGQAGFPLLQANISDSGAYGLSVANIQPSVTKTVGTEGIKVAIMGIGNHLVPQFELPSNIPGLSFSNPLTRAQTLSNSLRATNDVVIALTHIGFTENPSSSEVDSNVDTNLAATVTGLNAIIGGHSHTNPASGFGNYKYLPTILADPDGRPVVTTQAYRYNNTLGEVVMGLRARIGGGYDVVSQTGRYLTVTTGTAEDADVKAIVDPYTTLLTAYNATAVGATTAPIDTTQAFTQETNGANLQADASVYELETLHGIPVDFHLSGAMTNKLIASGATPASPFSLKISDMFSAMPYENSLVVLHLNGPQIKAILERGYRNYYYYKYVPGYGGYSYYTTCMLDTDASARIIYDDRYPTLPSGNNVVSLTVNGTPVDFKDSGTYYNVSTINYLAAGSCNFNDGGVTLWPLNQIQQDTQYYVRDAVIDYIGYRGTVNPAIEGRLTFSKYFTISGTLGPAGAGGSVIYTGGSTLADAITGTYSFWVPAGWSGSATPGKTDTSFTPLSRSYLDVIGDVSGQNYAVLPTVTRISPSIGSAAGGTTVTISGTGFDGATGVKFGSSVATFFLNTPTRITTTSPAGSAGTTVHITVMTPVGTSATSAADQFTYANVAKNVSSGALYTSLTSALAAAVTGNEIRVLNTQLDGDVILDRAVLLYGGWDSTFLSQGALPTTLYGSLTVVGGDSTASNLAARGVLAVRGGCLRVNNVAVIP